MQRIAELDARLLQIAGGEKFTALIQVPRFAGFSVAATAERGRHRDEAQDDRETPAPGGGYGHDSNSGLFGDGRKV